MYHDDLAAAQARISALEEELRRSRCSWRNTKAEVKKPCADRWWRKVSRVLLHDLTKNCYVDRSPLYGMLIVLLAFACLIFGGITTGVARTQRCDAACTVHFDVRSNSGTDHEDGTICVCEQQPRDQTPRLLFVP